MSILRIYYCYKGEYFIANKALLLQEVPGRIDFECAGRVQFVKSVQYVECEDSSIMIRLLFENKIREVVRSGLLKTNRTFIKGYFSK